MLKHSRRIISASPMLLHYGPAFSITNSRQLLVEIDDLQLLVFMHPSYVHIHVRRELGLFRAIRTLIARFLAALKLAMRLHIGQSSVAAVASGTMELLSCDRGLYHHAVGPTRRSNRCYGAFLTTSRVDIKIRILLSFLHRVQIVTSLIGVRGHAASGHYLGMCVRRMMNLPVKRI